MTLADLTPLQRAELQRDQALRFLSHDMRSPVASILALTDQLGRTLASDAVQLAKVSTLAAHAQELIRAMNGFALQSRAQSDTLQLSERLLDDLIEEAVAQAQAIVRNLRLLVADGEIFFFVQVDSQLVVRALFNMIMHAVRHGLMGSQVELLSRQAGTPSSPVVELEINYQVPLVVLEAPQDLAEGLGWGLDLAEMVAARHGGSIRRANLGQGAARLVLSLPCQGEIEL